MKQRILVIDGHPVYGNKLIGFLGGLTFKNVHLVNTGEKGIQEVVRQTPDLVILSSRLADMDSLIVCKEIRAMTQSSTKIIVQVGLFIPEADIAQFKANGANVVLERREKDLTPLQEAIEELTLSKAAQD